MVATVRPSTGRKNLGYVVAARDAFERAKGSGDQIDPAIAEPIDTTDHSQLFVVKGRAQDWICGPQLCDVVDHILPDSFAERITRLLFYRFYCRRNAGDERRHLTRQRRAVLQRFDNCLDGAAAIVTKDEDQRHA